jgi:hypothetical protein
MISQYSGSDPVIESKHSRRRSGGAMPCYHRRTTCIFGHAISCAAGHNIRWPLRAIAAAGVEALLLRLLMHAAWGGSGRGVQSIATAGCWADLLVRPSLQGLVTVPAAGAAIWILQGRLDG